MIELLLSTLVGVSTMVITVCTMSCLIVASEVDDCWLNEQQYIN